MADLFETMSTLRAVRRLRPDPVADGVIERLLQAACWAPTGGNTQPWRIVVVQDAEAKQRIADVYAPEWESYSAGFMDGVSKLPADQVAKWRRVTNAGDHLAQYMADAPALIIFAINPKLMAITDAELDRPSVVGGASVYPAVQNLLLACVAEGLGCTLTTLHCVREPEIGEIIDLPDGWGTAALVPIGYPLGGGHGPITRRPPAKMAFRNTFGEPWGVERHGV